MSQSTTKVLKWPLWMTYIFTLNCLYLLSPPVLFSSSPNSSAVFSSLLLPFFRSSVINLCSPTPFSSPLTHIEFPLTWDLFANRNTVECGGRISSNELQTESVSFWSQGCLYKHQASHTPEANFLSFTYKVCSLKHCKSVFWVSNDNPYRLKRMPMDCMVICFHSPKQPHLLLHHNLPLHRPSSHSKLFTGLVTNWACHSESYFLNKKVKKNTPNKTPDSWQPVFLTNGREGNRRFDVH